MGITVGVGYSSRHIRVSPTYETGSSVSTTSRLVPKSGPSDRGLWREDSHVRTKRRSLNIISIR